MRPNLLLQEQPRLWRHPPPSSPHIPNCRQPTLQGSCGTWHRLQQPPRAHRHRWALGNSRKPFMRSCSIISAYHPAVAKAAIPGIAVPCLFDSPIKLCTETSISETSGCKSRRYKLERQPEQLALLTQLLQSAPCFLRNPISNAQVSQFPLERVRQPFDRSCEWRSAAISPPQCLPCALGTSFQEDAQHFMQEVPRRHPVFPE